MRVLTLRSVSITRPVSTLEDYMRVRRTFAWLPVLGSLGFCALVGLHGCSAADDTGTPKNGTGGSDGKSGGSGTGGSTSGTGGSSSGTGGSSSGTGGSSDTGGSSGTGGSGDTGG